MADAGTAVAGAPSGDPLCGNAEAGGRPGDSSDTSDTEAPGHEAHREVVVFENEQVRVAQEHVPIGASIPTHTHDRPAVIVPITGDRACLLDLDGNLLMETFFAELPPGAAFFQPAGATHSLHNVGSRPILSLRIELL